MTQPLRFPPSGAPQVYFCTLQNFCGVLQHLQRIADGRQHLDEHTQH